jgi:hypothetical protein
VAEPRTLLRSPIFPGQWIDKVQHRRPAKTIVLDMDSSESPTYGDQEGSAYNGHFGCACYKYSTSSAMSSGAFCDAATCKALIAVARSWAGDRTLSRQGEAALFPRRRGLRQSRDV